MQQNFCVIYYKISPAFAISNVENISNISYNCNTMQKIDKILKIYLHSCKFRDNIYQCMNTEGGATELPNIKSAKKRVLVNATKAANNKAANSALKTAVKKANAAIEANDADKAEVVKVAVKKLDQAAAKGLIHKNNAAHKKSQLVNKLNKS